MCGCERVCIAPLHIVDYMASILASMQRNGNKAGLLRHEASAFGHEIDYLILLVGRQFHGRDLSEEGIAFQNVSHGKTFPEILSDNAEPIAAFMAGYVRNPTFQEPSAVELSYVRFTPKRGHLQCN